MEANPAELIKLATMRMPFGKYKGVLLLDLPERYVVWINQAGLPNGELGRLLRQIYDIKANGLEYLIRPLQKLNDTDR